MINYESLTGFSQIVSKLSIFLFIIAGNYVGDIYSCGIRNFMKEYMFVKHIIGFFIMLFFVGLVQETSGGTVSLVDGTEGRGYHRFLHSTRPSGQTYGASVIVNVAANSIYDLRFGITKQSIATQKLRTMPTGTSFLIEAIT